MSDCEPKRSQKRQFIDNLLHSRDVQQTKELYSQWALDYDEVRNEMMCALCALILYMYYTGQQ